MWIDVYPNRKMNFNSKNGRKTTFSYEAKTSKSFILTRRTWLWWKEMTLLSESTFFPIERWNSILKIVERKVFLTKPKHSNRLSQQIELVYNAQSCIERRLLCESAFIPIKRRTSILKILEREVFPMKPKHQNIYPNEDNVIMVPNHEKNRDYYVNPRLYQLKDELEF